MVRRLTVAALLTLCVLPGCRCFGDRSNLSRSNDIPPAPFPGYGGPTYPIASGGVHGDPNCNCQQGGGGIIYGAPPGGGGAVIIPPGSTLPPPGEMPRIPKAGIQEGPGGKQFDADGKEMGKGPATMPAIPVVGPALPVPVLPKLK